MNTKVRSQMRDYVNQRLRMKGDAAPLSDEDSLFSSGRLDSLDAVEIVMCIETEYGINFFEINFDLTLLDSIDAITSLVDRRPGQS
jgi:acyl carrier protein